MFVFPAIIMLFAIVSKDSGKTIIFSILFIFMMDVVRILSSSFIISLEEQDLKVKLMVTNDAYSLTDEVARRLFDRFYMAISRVPEKAAA